MAKKITQTSEIRKLNHIQPIQNIIPQFIGRFLSIETIPWFIWGVLKSSWPDQNDALPSQILMFNVKVTELWKRVEPDIFQDYPVVPEGCTGITYTATVTSGVTIQAGFPSLLPTEAIWDQCVLLFTYS